MFFFRMPFAQVYFRRNYPDIAFTSPVAMNTSNGQPSALTIFETALWLPGCGACSEGLPLMGLHFVHYSTLCFHSAATLHTRDTGVCISPSTFVQWFQVLTKRPIVLLKCSSCALHIRFRGAGHRQQLSTRFCALKDSRAEAHLFCKLSQAVRFFPVAFQSTLFQLYQGLHLLEDCVKLPVCPPPSLT